VILLFDGGLGDAISLAALLEGLKKTFNISSDVACRLEVWECILKPLGFKGGWRRPPLHTKQIHEYDYIQTKADRFFLQKRQRWDQCVLEELEHAYKVDLKRHGLTYAIPADVLEASYLLETARVRIGVNFDSQGEIRSYPSDLQPLLLELLLQADSEVFMFGQRRPNLAHFSKDERLRDLTGGTSIFELAALISRMDVILGVDSFIAHLANILGIRTLVMLTVTRKGVFRRHPNVSCLESLIECAPCGRVGNRCPLGYARCNAFFHDSLTPERIARAVVQECARHFKRIIEQRARDTAPSIAADG
jgi:ADP-heptose:LPS heptosyltransferase